METQTLDIPVLWPNYFEDCEQCMERLKTSLMGLDGMQLVQISPDRKSVDVTYDKSVLTFEEIRDHAGLVGVTIAEKYKHQSIRINGLDCPDCAMKLETAVKRMNGVVWASVNFATSVLATEYEPATTNIGSIEKRVEDFGYEVEIKEAIAPETPKTASRKNVRLALTAISGALLLAGGIAIALGANRELVSILFLLSAFTGGLFVARSGILSLKGFSFDTNFLMTVAAIGAIALGEYYEAAGVMFLFSLGATLEAYTVDRTRKSISSLMEAFPTHATVKRNEHLTEVPLDQIEIGETVIIKPGDKVAVDGTIISGESSLNEAPITGESVPKNKAKGDSVYAGSINGRGSLEVRTTSTSADNTLARIVHMVEDAQAHKAPSQQFSETFGRYYTPAVIGIAVLIAIAGPLAFGGAVRDWIVRALTLLVVSCPCALVISTPVAIVAAIGNAAKNGILIKGGAHLETLGDVSIVAFDKTGTLTTGNLEVCDIFAFNGHSAEEIMSVAAAAESRSEHPLADAIIAKAAEMHVLEKQVSFFEAFPGKGAQAIIDGQGFYIGSRRLMEEIGIPMIHSDEIARILAKGVTVIYLADEKSLWGAIAATDTIKVNSAEAISRLKNTGIVKTIMLTGDTSQTGKAVAKQLGIDEEFAELLPEDKLEKIKFLTSGPHKVAMVGDGINDAPALAAAHVGVAMGGAGTQAAVEAADVALMADDIVMLPYAVSLSRRARRIIRQNITFALLAVVLLVTGALLRWVTLATGVLGHEGSALLVIANSMRLLKRR